MSANSRWLDEPGIYEAIRGYNHYRNMVNIAQVSYNAGDDFAKWNLQLLVTISHKMLLNVAEQQQSMTHLDDLHRQLGEDS